MSPLQLAILEIIKANDGKFSWYQIDRVLSRRTIDNRASGNLISAVRGLEQAGFITTTAGHNPAQPLYSVTLAGQQQLELHRA